MMKFAITPLVLSTATFGLMLGAAQNAQASKLITGVTISNKSSNITENWALINVINGSGMPGGKASLTGTHAISASGNSWRTNNTGGVPSTANPFQITFKLGTVPTNLGGFSFWNLTGGSPTGISTTMGVKDASLDYATDGTGTTFTRVWTGTLAQGGNFAQGPELINFAPVEGVTHVRLNITSNYGQAQRVGFNEIAFKAIPEPSASLALLALGLGGMGVGLRKRV